MRLPWASLRVAAAAFTGLATAAAAVAAEGDHAEHWEYRARQLAYPPALACSDLPEWDAFRRQATDYVASGWPAAGEAAEAVEASARALLEKWQPLVCEPPCRTTEDLRWGWIEHLGGKHCADSAQFHRYIVVHFFENRELPCC
eukprot:TRINITY_DN33189_c0_g1_i1.p1 TRINITY_DN33189_c0_g1~~TRINITY_DN33189_c0_g1_i1.p1  ORF type:complete len:144 (+),score=27.65 TRINITY_DN33189_c0_g1_i1:144-575(+)